MHRKLTITLDEAVYDGLYRVVGQGNISQFIEDVVRPYVTKLDLEEEYREMAADQESEAEALEWIEAFVGDIDA